MNQETHGNQTDTSRQIFELQLEEALRVAGGQEVDEEPRPV